MHRLSNEYQADLQKALILQTSRISLPELTAEHWHLARRNAWIAGWAGVQQSFYWPWACTWGRQSQPAAKDLRLCWALDLGGIVDQDTNHERHTVGGAMSDRLELWARTERQMLNEEVAYLKAGGKVISPSGDDITSTKLEQLCARLEGVNKVLNEIENALRP